MNTRLIFSLVVLVNLGNSLTVKDRWIQFKTTYGKHYSAEEDLQRFDIFNENLAKIQAHNVKYERGEVTFYKKINKFGDLTASEFLNFVNRTNTQKIKSPEVDRGRYVVSKESSAAEVDWRTKNVLSEVKDEGDCGSSWSFSAIGALESQLAIKTGQVTPLSEQNLIDCSNDYGNAGCDGGFQNSAFDYITENGIMSGSDYPYEGITGTCRFDPSKIITKITSYVEIDFMSEVGLADAVAKVGPIAASVDATEELQFYYGGIFFDDTCNINFSDLNHGVLVVGYGKELQYDYWIVKNSWGVDWGENGYYQSIRNYGNNCGIATHASYPQI